jgi:hypothetical protein
MFGFPSEIWDTIHPNQPLTPYFQGLLVLARCLLR